ncbi:MAG TPA: outer membrane beta-barrel protein, partial [Verrucomicrobiae bacterium]|nr:outer membrane beta-barrel protein [Verrucomicrobiae bacterium]
GWDQLPDNNNTLSYMGRIGYAFDSNTTFAALGYGGPEQASNTGNWRDGAELVATRKITDKFTADVQLDYGHEANAFLSDGVTQSDAEWYAGGVWLVYDFTDKIELTFRQDFLRDRKGSRSGATFGLPVGETPELYSSTLTLNYKPIDNIQIRPEFRWDHSDKVATFNGERDQFTLGMGVAYLF